MAFISQAAYYGIAGEFVNLVEPHSEADPSFLLLSFLVCAGSIFGRKAFILAGGDRHYTNLFACRCWANIDWTKGSAWGPLEIFFRLIDELWVASIQSGLSSGEGLIWNVRDPLYKRQNIAKRDEPEQNEPRCL